MAEEFVKIDLHIHTPASDDYKGKKSGEEYLNILRQAKAKGLKVIAITDHNSIKGYSEYLSLEDELVKRKAEMSSSDSNENVKELRRVEKDLSLFKEIDIFPGIEFETRNNVHMLIVFNKNTTVERMGRLLFDGGYRDFGEENPKITPNWDVLDLYENSKIYDCIILDAHTDSNKGIWTQTKPGSYRARCFVAPELYGIGYKSESQRENISGILSSAREYKRDNPISFVKFSDAHSCNEVGSQFTWLRESDSYDLSYLKSALRNPSEYISIEEPSLARILDRIISLPNTFGIPDITNENKEYFKKLVCGLNNSEGGYILFGVSSEKKKIGIGKGDGEDRRRITRKIDDCIKDIEGSPILRKNVFPYIVDRAIFSIRVIPGEEIIGIKDEGKVYSIKDNKLLTLSAQETQNLVEAKFTDKIEGKISRRIQEVERDCGQIKAYFASFPIIRKFEIMSNLANLKPIYEESIKLEDDEIGKLKRDPYNGLSKGNIFFLRELEKPRLEDTYLRYSLPIFTIQNLGIKSEKEPTIYIVPGGGVFYSERDYPFYNENELVVKKLKGDFQQIGMKFVACFLKSSFNLFYCGNKFDSEDIYMDKILNRIRLPSINLKIPEVREKLLKIERNFNKIIELEKMVLRGGKDKNPEQFIETVASHNMEVDRIAYEIDLIIYDILNVSTMEVSTIEENLKLNNIYIPEFDETKK